MSFITRFFQKRFCVVLFLFGLFLFSVSNAFSQNIIITVDSISGRLGEKHIPLDIRITATQDTITGFELWFQLSRPDIITFPSVNRLSVNGSIISNWWVWANASISNSTNLDVFGSYPIPDASQYLYPAVSNGLFFQCFVDVVDSFAVPPTDSLVDIFVITDLLDKFVLYDQFGNIIDRSTIEVHFGSFTLLPACGYDDGIFDITGLVALVEYMFGGGPVLSVIEADCNCDCLIDVADLVCFVDYMFGGGTSPGCGN